MAGPGSDKEKLQDYLQQIESVSATRAKTNLAAKRSHQQPASSAIVAPERQQTNATCEARQALSPEEDPSYRELSSEHCSLEPDLHKDAESRLSGSPPSPCVGSRTDSAPGTTCTRKLQQKQQPPEQSPIRDTCAIAAVHSIYMKNR
ncbi:hypothetical protein WJX72_001283 [[Myrmecia] bisecta]|uniref:Uncharacterized protein n=1 Tax=[Myrmecia] bisecta TaxID=41462 RepID=A0AAW1QP51_9CHLO